MTPHLIASNEIDTSTPSLPKFGTLRIRRKALHALRHKDDDVSWTPSTSGPFIVPITRWIE